MIAGRGRGLAGGSRSVALAVDLVRVPRWIAGALLGLGVVALAPMIRAWIWSPWRFQLMTVAGLGRGLAGGSRSVALAVDLVRVP